MGAFDEANQLLAVARKDLNALQAMQDVEVFADEIFGFHAQQAIEKILKAWLSALGLRYPRTHDLTLLISIFETNGHAVDDLHKFVEFNPYAVQFRYNAFDELGSVLDRSSVASDIACLFQRVEEHIAKQE